MKTLIILLILCSSCAGYKDARTELKSTRPEYAMAEAKVMYANKSKRLSRKKVHAAGKVFMVSAAMIVIVFTNKNDRDETH